MKRQNISWLILFALVVLASVPVQLWAQDQAGESSTTGHLLRWHPAVDSRIVYMLSTSGTRGDNISVITENFTIEMTADSDGMFHFTANGEAVPDGAPLGYRFQRSLWPEFKYTVDKFGNTESSKGQPFPPFLNIPVFPEYAVHEGDTWSGTALNVLPDSNVGAIPFDYTSTLTAIANYKGEKCAVIETAYAVAIPDGTRSFIPFIGLVEGDEPDEPGQGALIGGIVEGSRAQCAGFEPGDMITAAQGQKIRGWGGLREILPLMVPEMAVQFTVMRNGSEIKINVAPEGLPAAYITGSGGMRSTCYFSIERGMPLNIDLASDNLTFTLTNDEGVQEERSPELHFVLDYQRGN